MLKFLQRKKKTTQRRRQPNFLKIKNNKKLNFGKVQKVNTHKLLSRRANAFVGYNTWQKANSVGKETQLMKQNLFANQGASNLQALLWPRFVTALTHWRCQNAACNIPRSPKLTNDLKMQPSAISAKRVLACTKERKVQNSTGKSSFCGIWQ